jgi:hypothetical protein
MQNEVDFYHTSDSCVTSGRGRLHRSRSRFFSDFGRINCIESIGASPGKDPRSRTHDKTSIRIV